MHQSLASAPKSSTSETLASAPVGDACALAPPGGLTTLYNARCPICRAEIEHYIQVDGRHGSQHAWIDLHEAPQLLARYSLDEDTASRRLYVVDGAGRLHGGVDAFLLIWRSLPGFGWLARLAALPGVRGLADLVYERVLAPALYAWNRRRRRRAGAR